MKVLLIHSANAVNDSTEYTFVEEQAKALRKLNVEIDYFGVKGHGFWGYLKNYKLLRKRLKVFSPDLVHAHYGLSGLLANLQRKVPVVCTYHGSDINIYWIRLLSKISIKLSAYNIFVSKKIIQKSGVKKNYSHLPCGIDHNLFIPIEQERARIKLGFLLNEKLVLFSGSFTNKVKNYKLAQNAMSLIKGVKLIELKGYTRKEVVLLLNACDCLLMTSFTEGSPIIIKEAMACNCPIVSVNVADVNENIQNVENCYVTQYDALEISNKINFVINSGNRSNGRSKLFELELTNEGLTKRLFEIYRIVLNKKR